MGKKILMFLACAVMSAGIAFAQQQVTGTVIDSETGEPLVGATVKVKGTTQGVLTDMDGKFTLKNLPSRGSTLVVTCMGMKPVEVKSAAKMTINMESVATDLQDVMVVAYGTAKRSAFTGSAAVIGSDHIEKLVTTSVTNALQGTAPGVQFTDNNGDPASSGIGVTVRGIGSINASNSPLVVLDGSPYAGGLSSLNPADVESITVLKDASSAAIYGARGANGVILVTTKKGRDQKAEISFDAKWGSNSRMVPRYDMVNDPGQYYEMYFKRLYNSNVNSGMSSSEAYADANNRLFDAGNGGLGYQIYTLPEGENLIGTNFRLNPNAKLGYSDGDFYYTPDDWYDEAFHNGFRQEYNINLSGASERLSYYAGVGFLNNQGIVDNSGLKRYNGRVNVDYQARNWLRVSSNMNYTYSDSDQPDYGTTWGSSGNMFYAANSVAPIYPLYVRNADGSYKMQNGMRVYDAGTTTNFKRAGLSGNALRDNVYDRSKNYRDMFNGNWSAVITPVTGLNLTANIAVTNVNSRSNALYSAFGSQTATDGAASASHSRTFAVNNQYLANYKTDFNGSKHSLDALLGYEQYRVKEQSLSGSNDHLFNPFIGELNNALGKENRSVGSYTQNYMTEGVFVRAQYDYDDRFFVDGSYRRDACSRFAPGHRWGNFGSAGFAWAMNKEEFLADQKWIDLLKFKASYGLQGNEGLGNYYVYADMYSPSYNPTTGEYSTTLTQKGNEELTWEKIHSVNVGFDFNFFKKRLNGSVEYFVKKTTDMLFYKDFPLSSGFGADVQLPVNVGSMMNHGIEVDLEGVLVRTKDVEWSLNLNFTHYKNKILKLDPAYAEDGIKYANSILREGGSIYETYMYKYAGVDKSNGAAMYYKDDNHYFDLDGKEISKAKADELGKGKYTMTTNRVTTTSATDATRYECGSSLPKLFGGFGTSLRVKDFDLSASLSYQLGGQVYDGAYQALMWTQDEKGLNMHKDLLKAWSPTNPNSNIPQWYDNMWGSLAQSNCDYFLTSSNYLSLNNLTLGYTFPKALLSKVRIGSLRVYVAGQNLAVVSARRGLDPRTTMGIGSMISGTGRYSTGYYTPVRSIVAGLSVKF